MNNEPPRLNKKFYVFYDKNDFVKCFGTAEQLVNEGFFKTYDSVRQVASKIKAGKLKGNVVVLPLEEGEHLND